jgi:hypothetical protein
MGKTQMSWVSLIICLCFTLLSSEHKELTIQNVRTAVIDNQKKPSKSLQHLLKELNIIHNDTLTGIIFETQKKWLRPKNKERGQLKDTLFTKKEFCMPLFKNMGMLDQVHPSFTEYDYALILGVEVPLWAYQRIFFCKQLLDQGKINVKHLVILACQRRVDLIFPELKTETNLMKFLLERTGLQEKTKSLPTTFINLPMKKEKENQEIPPSTRDTVQQWLEQKPKPGKCLIFSNQPFVGYQDAVLQETLPEGFTVDTVGLAPKEGVNGSLYLDTLARWLYEKQFGNISSNY